MKSLFLIIALSSGQWAMSQKNAIGSCNMEAQIAVLNLGVHDLQKSYKFYHDGLGFPSKGIIGEGRGRITFFDLKNGIKLGLYERKNLAWDSKTAENKPSSTELSVGYSSKSEQEVDAIMLLAKNAGATITKHAEKTFWGGYSGYFKDIDGHLWEIQYNSNLISETLKTNKMIKFAYTILYVEDVSKTISFYEKAFDFKQKFITPDSSYGELSSGETTLSFASKTLAHSNLKEGFIESSLSQKPFGIEIGFKTDDVPNTVTKAVRAGAIIVAEPKTKPWGQVVAYVRDTDGFLIEICTPVE